MTEKVQLPFAAIHELQKRAEDTWNKVHSSCLLDPRELEVLTQSIDGQLKALKAQCPAVEMVTKAAQEQLSAAHKECSDQFIDRWVDDITTRAVDLRHVAPTLSQKECLRRVRDIRATILELREFHSLNEENRKYLRLAESLLSQLEHNTPKPVTTREKLVELNFNDVPLDIDLAEKHCEMSHLFFSDNIEGALLLFDALPEQEQKEITSLVKTLGYCRNDLLSDDEEVGLEASIAFSRACMARSNLRAQNGEGMPSEEDIAMLFEIGFNESDIDLN